MLDEIECQKPGRSDVFPKIDVLNRLFNPNTVYKLS